MPKRGRPAKAGKALASGAAGLAGGAGLGASILTSAASAGATGFLSGPLAPLMVPLFAALGAGGAVTAFLLSGVREDEQQDIIEAAQEYESLKSRAHLTKKESKRQKKLLKKFPIIKTDSKLIVDTSRKMTPAVKEEMDRINKEVKAHPEVAQQAAQVAGDLASGKESIAQVANGTKTALQKVLDKEGIPAELTHDGLHFKGDSKNGYPPQEIRFQRFTPEQQSAMQSLLQGSMGQLGREPFSFDPIEQRAREDFAKKTIPGIAERFTQVGAQRSSAFPQLLSQSGKDLETELAAMRSDYNDRRQHHLRALLGLGLTPQYESTLFPGYPGTGVGSTAAERWADRLGDVLTDPDKALNAAKDIIKFGKGAKDFYVNRRQAQDAAAQAQEEAGTQTPDTVSEAPAPFEAGAARAAQHPPTRREILEALANPVNPSARPASGIPQELRYDRFNPEHRPTRRDIAQRMNDSERGVYAPLSGATSHAGSAPQDLEPLYAQASSGQQAAPAAVGAADRDSWLPSWLRFGNATAQEPRVPSEIEQLMAERQGAASGMPPAPGSRPPMFTYPQPRGSVRSGSAGTGSGVPIFAPAAPYFEQPGRSVSGRTPSTGGLSAGSLGSLGGVDGAAAVRDWVYGGSSAGSADGSRSSLGMLGAHGAQAYEDHVSSGRTTPQSLSPRSSQASSVRSGGMPAMGVPASLGVSSASSLQPSLAGDVHLSPSVSSRGSSASTLRSPSLGSLSATPMLSAASGDSLGSSGSSFASIPSSRQSFGTALSSLGGGFGTPASIGSRASRASSRGLPPRPVRPAFAM